MQYQARNKLYTDNTECSNYTYNTLDGMEILYVNQITIDIAFLPPH